MSGVYISAAHKSSGKTLCTMGLCAALRRRGYRVQPFKKGPDYIDPLWLGEASGRACHNLDFYTMTRHEIVDTFRRHGAEADISIVEGTKGLHDSVDLAGHQSNASLAKLLATPVVLVIDTEGMTRGIAALLQGLQYFDRDITLAGVILNNVASARHADKLRGAVEAYTDVGVLGVIPRDDAMFLREQHLGLVPANETSDAGEIIGRIGRIIETRVDVGAILARSGSISAQSSPLPASPRARATPDIRVGITRDEAFGFYYPGDLEALQRAGAELVAVDTLRDRALPPIDGLFMGGGFPERHMHALSANGSLRAEIRRAVARGLPVYAECGGLMYLAKRMVWGDRRGEMVGALEADVVIRERPQGRGYVRLRETEHAPWPRAGKARPGRVFPAHEFHYSELRNASGNFEYAYDVVRGHGIDGRHDGIVFGNVLASYVHLRDTHRNHWTKRFVSFVRDRRSPRRAGNVY